MNRVIGFRILADMSSPEMLLGQNFQQGKKMVQLCEMGIFCTCHMANLYVALSAEGEFNLHKLNLLAKNIFCFFS